MMIENTRARPEFCQSRPDGRDAPAWLAGNNQGPHAGGRQIDLFLGGDFRETDRVSGSAAKDRDAIVQNGSQPC